MYQEQSPDADFSPFAQETFEQDLKESLITHIQVQVQKNEKKKEKKNMYLLSQFWGKKYSYNEMIQ